MKRLAEIEDKLKELKSLDRDYDIHGANVHGYEFNASLPLKEVEEFEKRYSVQLPSDYKEFITEIGNGGAGPNNGMFPLAESFGQLYPCNHFNNLKEAFPHTQAWNLTQEMIEKFWKVREAGNEEMEKFHQHFDAQYWKNNALTSGSLLVGDYGCESYFLLVISGNEKGNVWFDDRAALAGIIPFENEKKRRMCFSDWYVDWLDVSIQSLKP